MDFLRNEGVGFITLHEVGASIDERGVALRTLVMLVSMLGCH